MTNSATKGNQFKNGNILLSEIYQIDPSKLNFNTLNSYFNYGNAEIEILKADINNRGIIVPIIIKDDKTIISGLKRFKVALALNFINVPVQRIISEVTPETERELLFKDNILRRQLRYKVKKELINNLYEDEISLDHRGSYLKNQKLKSKNSVEYYIPQLWS